MDEGLSLKQSNILCPYYISGHCKYASNCVYSHTPEEALRKTTMCKFWLKKKCVNKQCHFAHGDEELKPQRAHYKLNSQMCKLRPIGISEKEYCKYGQLNNVTQNKQNEAFAISKKCSIEERLNIGREEINEKRIGHQMTNNFEKSKIHNNSAKKYNSCYVTLLKKKYYDGINNDAASNHNDNISNNGNYNCYVGNCSSHEFDNNNYKPNVRNNMFYKTKKKKNFLNDNFKNGLESNSCTLNRMNDNVDSKCVNSYSCLNSSTKNLSSCPVFSFSSSSHANHSSEINDKMKMLNHGNSNKNCNNLTQSTNFFAFSPYSTFQLEDLKSLFSFVLQEKKNNEESEINNKEVIKTHKNLLQLYSLIKMMNSKKLGAKGCNADTSNDKNNSTMNFDEFNLMQSLISNGISNADDNENDDSGVNDVILQCLLKNYIKNNNWTIDRKDDSVNNINCNAETFKLSDENTNMKNSTFLLNLLSVLSENDGNINETPYQMHEKTKDILFDTFQSTGTVVDLLAVKRLKNINNRESNIDVVHKNLLNTENEKEQQEGLQVENEEAAKLLFMPKNMDKKLIENVKTMHGMSENKPTKKDFLQNGKTLDKNSQSSLQHFFMDEKHINSPTHEFNHSDKDYDNDYNINTISDSIFLFKNQSATYINEDAQVSMNLKTHSDQFNSNINNNSCVLNDYETILQSSCSDHSSNSEYDFNHDDVMVHQTLKHSNFNENKLNENDALRVFMHLAQNNNQCDEPLKYDQEDFCFKNLKKEAMLDLLLLFLCIYFLNENDVTQQKNYDKIRHFYDIFRAIPINENESFAIISTIANLNSQQQVFLNEAHISDTASTNLTY